MELNISDNESCFQTHNDNSIEDHESAEIIQSAVENLETKNMKYTEQEGLNTQQGHTKKKNLEISKSDYSHSFPI